MGTKDKGDRSAFWAKQFRDFLDAKKSGVQTAFQTVEDIVYGLLDSNGGEMKLEEIYYVFFTQEGKQYDNDSMRAAVVESLRKLCDSGRVEHTKHGHYKVI